jgi:hypothetical protein
MKTVIEKLTNREAQLGYVIAVIDLVLIFVLI